MANANLYHLTKFPLYFQVVVYCSLFLDINEYSFTKFFIHKNYSELFLSARFLFLKILNLNLTFAVYVKLNLSSTKNEGL